jgi:CheY-like chemotaxis protein/phosphoribosyl 1,2-cyclic phosphodiesterase
MRVRFWGTRGSIAKPGPTTLRYGGNTSCVEVETDAGTLIVVDCGTGAHGLGQELLKAGRNRGHLLISHTHWDHIQGFPFFAPVFVPGQEWDIYAPGAAGGLEGILGGQMEYTYFPVTLDQLGGKTRYHDLTEGRFTIEEVAIAARYLNHPAVTLGYRLEVGGVSVIYSSDHEPHSRHQAEPPEAPRAGALPTLVHVEDVRHAEFLKGADLVIHDAQYTASEYPKKVGWGHSTVEYVVDVAIAAGVQRLALFHHDPLRTDAALDDVLAASRARAKAWGSTIEIFAAAEGTGAEFAEAAGRPDRLFAPAPVEGPTRAGPFTVLVVDDDPAIVSLVRQALDGEGYRLLSAANGRAGLEMVREETPDLVLLNWGMPEMDGIAVSRAIRADTNSEIRGVPIIMLTWRSGGDDARESFDAGADDYITKPLTPALVRTRVREWLARGKVASVK